MSLEDYMLELDFQSWMGSHGYDSMGVYPTGEPWAEVDGTTYDFDVSPDEFFELLRQSVVQDMDFITSHRVDEDIDEDSLVPPII